MLLQSAIEKVSPRSGEGQGRNNNWDRSGCLPNLDITSRVAFGLNPTASKTLSEIGSPSGFENVFAPWGVSIGRVVI